MDIKTKAARFIDKCNSLDQEFHFTHPQTMIKIQNIYNNHFNGSQLWKLNSKEFTKFESSYNKSVKIIFDLPWATYRYFVEQLTGAPHMRRLLVRRYISFIEKVRNSSKTTLAQLLELVQNDVRMTTGHNLRSIMLQSGLNRVSDIGIGNCYFEYHKVSEEDMWRIDFVRELVELRHEDLDVSGIETEDLEHILEYLCTT